MNFDLFWSLYPRKVAKLDAAKAWKQMTREYPPGEIIDGLRRNLPALQAKEKQFVKHPATWLRAGCWMDEPEPMRRDRKPNAFDAYEAICRERGWKPDEPDFVPSPDNDVERLPAERGEHAGAVVDLRPGAFRRGGYGNH